MTPILVLGCPRCRGALAPDDDDGYVCLMCGRSPAPALEPLPLVMGHGELSYRKRPTGHEGPDGRGYHRTDKRRSRP